MPHYIALIHKDTDSCYGVSFPDIPGVITGGDTIDEAMQQAAEVLQFAAEDWTLTVQPVSSRQALSTSCVAIPSFLKMQRTPSLHSSNVPLAPMRRNKGGARF
jgi:predicted RNase H-like HicB family nuclease